MKKTTISTDHALWGDGVSPPRFIFLLYLLHQVFQNSYLHNIYSLQVFTLFCNLWSWIQDRGAHNLFIVLCQARFPSAKDESHVISGC